MNDLSAVREAILKGDADAAVAAARIALDGGVNPVDIVRLGISPALAEVGTKFEEGEGFVPELLVAARATKTVFHILRPLLAQSGTKSSGHVILGTVRGDLHDIGKNLVAAMLEGGGFEVTDLGVDVPPEKFVATARDGRAHIVGLSALLTSTLPAMKTVVEAYCASGIRGSLRIMIGGAPATRAYADAIGADGYGESASAAVELARHLTDAQKTG